jgi:hypothetical protein
MFIKLKADISHAETSGTRGSQPEMLQGSGSSPGAWEKSELLLEFFSKRK